MVSSAKLGATDALDPRAMPTFAEQLVLSTLDEDGALPVREDVFVCALAGAVLLDLAFAGRIDTDLQALVVTDRAPTGHRALDRVLAKIAARQKPVETRAWIQELSVDDADAIREDVLAGLVERGALRLRRRRMSWRALASRYALVDESAKRDVHLRINDALYADTIPDPRDIALIALLDACDILPDILPAGAVEQRRERIDQLRKLELIGREVASAVADIERTVILALRARSARFRALLFYFSVGGGLAVAATLLAPRIAIPDRFGPTLYALLWLDERWQQWSGYTLASVSVAALASVLLLKTKRVARSRATHWWRLSHIALGLGGLALLFVHTGFRLGANVNAALMGCYLAALLFGALVGFSTGGAQWLRKMGVSPKLRPVLLRLHIATLVPLPALLAIHVLVVYLY